MAISGQKIGSFLSTQRDIAPLAALRILLGLLWAFALGRNLYHGWVEKFYLRPNFMFKFYGFDWVQPLPAWLLYPLVIALIIAALCISLGWHFRLAAWFFFLGFTYLELLDVTHYLNHYYFLSLVAFLLACSPAGHWASVDVHRGRVEAQPQVAAWQLYLFAAQISLVYFFAGVAKLHEDWLIEAQPLRIWLQRHSEFPLIGSWLAWRPTAHFFSLFGLVYDLFIWLFLLWPRSRTWAFASVLAFHLLTWLLFNIGVFPWMMIVMANFFLSNRWHQKINCSFAAAFNLTLSKLKLPASFRLSQAEEGCMIGAAPAAAQRGATLQGSLPLGPPSGGLACGHPSTSLPRPFWRLGLPGAFWGLYLLWQLVWPCRCWFYGGDVLWHEQGFRFSWRVMLVEKVGQVQFRVVDERNPEREALADNRQFLTAKQEVMMSIQPDLIAQFARHLAQYYEQEQGFGRAAVYADAFVSLNARPSQRFIRPDVDLTQVSASPWRAWSPLWVIPEAR